MSSYSRTCRISSAAWFRLTPAFQETLTFSFTKAGSTRSHVPFDSPWKRSHTFRPMSISRFSALAGTVTSIWSMSGPTCSASPPATFPAAAPVRRTGSDGRRGDDRAGAHTSGPAESHIGRYEQAARVSDGRPAGRGKRPPRDTSRRPTGRSTGRRGVRSRGFREFRYGGQADPRRSGSARPPTIGGSPPGTRA